MGKSFIPSLLFFSAFDRPDGDDDHDGDDGADDGDDGNYGDDPLLHLQGQNGNSVEICRKVKNSVEKCGVLLRSLEQQRLLKQPELLT